MRVVMIAMSFISEWFVEFELQITIWNASSGSSVKPLVLFDLCRSLEVSCILEIFVIFVWHRSGRYLCCYYSHLFLVSKMFKKFWMANYSVLSVIKLNFLLRIKTNTRNYCEGSKGKVCLQFVHSCVTLPKTALLLRYLLNTRKAWRFQYAPCSVFNQ